MKKEDLVLIFFDLETTGLNPDIDEVIEIGAIKVKGGEVVEHFHTFVRPHRNIPSLVTNLTGITYKDVEDAPDPAEIRKKLEEFIGSYPLIAHNVSFDRIFLEKFMGKRLDNEFFDTLELARIFFPDLPSHSLQNLVKALSLKKEKAHRALSDTMMLYSLFDKISYEKDNASPFLLHKIKSISRPIRHFESIFGDKWEKPEENEEDFIWKSSGNISETQTLPFGVSREKESPLKKYFSEGIVYAENFSENELIDWIVSLSSEEKLAVSVYNSSLKDKIVSSAREEGLKVFCLNNFSRFVCPKKIDYLIAHPELITDNFRMSFATLFSYLYKTRDFLLKNAPTHILKNPLLRLLSFCDNEKKCEYESVCPLKEAIRRTQESDIVVLPHSFFFNDLSNVFDISGRKLVFLNSYRLIKAFYSSKTGFSQNDFLFFANFYKFDKNRVERIKEVFRTLEEKSIGEDVKWAADEMRMLFSNFDNPLLKSFFEKEYFWMERRGDSPVIFGANKRTKEVFSFIRDRAENILFFTPILSADDSKNVLKDFTGIDGKDLSGKNTLNGKFVSIVPLFMHSPNRDEFTAEFADFFNKVHIPGKRAIMLFSSTETLKKVYFLLKRNGVDAKARGIDLKSEHGEVDLYLYDTSFSGDYDEIYFVRLPSVTPSFYGKNRSQILLYSVYIMKNVAAELLQNVKTAEIYYFDGRFKTPSFRARFGNDFVSFPLFVDGEQALMFMLSNWRKRNI